MNRRSQGILKRKEDNVNILDLESLYSYIRNTYDYTDPLIMFVLPVISGVRKEPALFITLTNCKHNDRNLYYKENDSVFMTYDDVNALNCMDLLSKKYNAFYKRGSKYTKSMVYISPKDNSKKIDNRFFLEVLDYILMNIKNPCLTKKKNVNESHWSEMNRRSQGIVVRKEDDIDLMDVPSFCDYLNKIYRTESESCIKTYTFNYEDEKPIYTIVIDLYANERGVLNQLYYDNEHIDIRQSALKEIGCEKEFNDAFLTKNYMDSYGVINIEVFPKDRNRKVTNKFVIEVIDFLLDKIDVPLEAQIEKIGDLKESHWSEMNRRSQGITVRKEDELDSLSGEDMVSYILKHYIILSGMYQPRLEDKNTLVIPIINWNKSKVMRVTNYLFYEYDKNRISTTYDLYSYKPFVQMIKSNFFTSPYDDSSMEILPKNKHKASNRFLVELIDFIIDNMDPMDRQAFVMLRKREQ